MNVLCERLGIELPVIQAPMAGVQGARLAAAVTMAGGLGSIPCAMLSETRIREAVADVRRQTGGPFNLNFFCHQEPVADERVSRFAEKLLPFYDELGIEPRADASGGGRQPFGEAHAGLVEALEPPVVSFHFGLPDDALLTRVKQTGALVLSSATTRDEAIWLEANGVDAVIAQGIEAGGHRGHFLDHDLSLQTSTNELLAAVLDAVNCPVIAAGGITTPEHVKHTMNLGAQCVQLGTAYLLCPEVDTSDLHRSALQDASAETDVTNLFTGRPARGIVNRIMRELGSINDSVPAFPLTSSLVTPLRKAAEARGDSGFSPLWAGTRFADCDEDSAANITRRLGSF